MNMLLPMSKMIDMYVLDVSTGSVMQGSFSNK